MRVPERPGTRVVRLCSKLGSQPGSRAQALVYPGVGVEVRGEWLGECVRSPRPPAGTAKVLNKALESAVSRDSWESVWPCVLCTSPSGTCVGQGALGSQEPPPNIWPLSSLPEKGASQRTVHDRHGTLNPGLEVQVLVLFVEWR